MAQTGKGGATGSGPGSRQAGSEPAFEPPGRAPLQEDGWGVVVDTATCPAEGPLPETAEPAASGRGRQAPQDPTAWDEGFSP